MKKKLDKDVHIIVSDINSDKIDDLINKLEDKYHIKLMDLIKEIAVDEEDTFIEEEFDMEEYMHATSHDEFDMEDYMHATIPEFESDDTQTASPTTDNSDDAGQR